MIDYYVKLLGVDHAGITTDDMFTTQPTMDFVAKNAGMYADGGYMTDAFDRGASGCAELSRILAAVTDELWKRVYREVWEGIAPEDDPLSPEARRGAVDEMRREYLSR